MLKWESTKIFQLERGQVNFTALLKSIPINTSDYFECSPHNPDHRVFMIICHFHHKVSCVIIYVSKPDEIHQGQRAIYIILHSPLSITLSLLGYLILI